MPRGKARCGKCGFLVIAEVEQIIECPGCGRKFYIPNEPRYTNPLNSLRSHSIARLSLGLGLGPLWNIEDSRRFTDAPEKKWEIHPEARRKDLRIKLLPFPARNDPELMLEHGWLRVIVEFYGHDEVEKIGVAVRKSELILQSHLSLCPYRNTIALPEGFGTISEATLRNGILEVRLKE
ncbi:MAG: hypothetical protein WC650_02315 [Candidatus Doudnabacteria bacterium]